MNKTGKRILAVAGIGVGLVLLMVVGLKLYFTSDRLKALVMPRVNAAIQREVRVERLSLSVYPRLGISLSNLVVANPAGATFDHEETLSLEELLLDVSIVPLLRGRLEINEVILRRPQISLEVNADGVANYAPPAGSESATQSAEPAAPQPPAGAVPLTAILSALRIENGTITYADNTADLQVRIDGYHQELMAAVGAGAGDALLRSTLRIDGLSYGDLRGFLITDLPVGSDLNLTYLGSEDVLTVDEASVTVHDLVLMLSGQVSQVRTSPVVDLALTPVRADLRQLLSLVPPDLLKGARGLSTSGAFEFAMQIAGAVSDSTSPDITGTLAVQNGSLQYAGLPKAITDINVAGGFALPGGPEKGRAPGRVTIQQLSAALGGSRFTGRLSIVNPDQPTIGASVDGSLNLTEVGDYYPLEPGTGLSGTLTARLSLSGRADAPQRMKADGQIRFVNVAMTGAALASPLENLNGNITLSNQAIETTDLTARIGASDAALTFALRNYLSLMLNNAPEATPPSLTGTLKSRRLRTMDFVAAETAPPPPEPAGQPAPPAPPLPGVAADLNLTVDRLETEAYTFTNARGALRIRDGVVTLEQLTGGVLGGEAKLSGVLDMRDSERRPLDLEMTIRGVQAKEFLPGWLAVGNHLFGTLSMTGSFRGALDDTLGIVFPSINGTGALDIRDGRVVGHPLTAKLAEFTGLPRFREIDFKDWTSAFALADGRLQVKDLRIDAGDAGFVVNGSHGLDGTMEYSLNLRLPAALTENMNVPGLGKEMLGRLRDAEGRVTVPLQVSGTTPRPILLVDMPAVDRAIRNILQEKAAEQTDKLKDAAKEKIGEGLKKLFNRQ